MFLCVLSAPTWLKKRQVLNWQTLGRALPALQSLGGFSSAGTWVLLLWRLQHQGWVLVGLFCGQTNKQMVSSDPTALPFLLHTHVGTRAGLGLGCRGA